MFGRIRDALSLLFFGRMPVERRLVGLESEMRSLLNDLQAMVEMFNAAQARAVKAIARREKKEMEARLADDAPAAGGQDTSPGFTPTPITRGALKGRKAELNRKKAQLDSLEETA